MSNKTTIISWNINSIGKHYHELKQLAETYNPEYICLQKVRNKIADLDKFTIPGYHGLFTSDDYGSMSGVMLYAKIKDGVNPIPQLDSMPKRILTPLLSPEGHLQVFDCGRFILANSYVPFTNPKLGGAEEYRKTWNERFHKLIVELSEKLPIIICGDMNIVHTDKDTFEDRYIQNRPCFSQWERESFDALLSDANLVDAFRSLHPKERKPSFYGNFRFLGIGNRIDYFLISRSLLPDVIASDVLTDFGTGQSVPIILTLKEQG